MTEPAERPSGEVQLLRTVLDATRLLVIVVDADGMVVDVNHAVERTAALPRERCRQPIWELAALPHERALLRASFSPVREEGLPPGMLFHLQGANAQPAVVDWEIRVIRDGAERPTVVLTGVDLTERLATQQHLRESEALQHLILERLPAVVWATDGELRFTFSAGGGLPSLGLGASQVATVGTSLYSYFHTTDPAHPAIAPHLRALAGEASAFELRWNDRLFQSRVEPLRDGQGRTVGSIGLAIDVTEQAHALEALRESEGRLRRLVESNVIGVLFWDAAGHITEANQAFLDLVGYTRGELLTGEVSWRAITPPEYSPLDERALVELSATGRCTPFEKEYVAKSGERVPVLVGGATFDAGHHSGVAVIVDLREQVRLRRRLDQLLAREQKARVETEVANARLLLLVEGSKRLSRTIRLDDTLAALAEVVVPGLADWSYVVHRGWNGGPLLVAFAHADPEKRKLLAQLERCAPDPSAPEGAPRVFRTGEPARYDDITTDMLLPSAPGWPIVGTRDPEHLHLIREIGMRSLLCVPIPGRSGVDAVMMLASGSDPHRFAADDVVLAMDLAGRAAVTLENARLLAETLDSIRARDDFVSVAAHELRTPLTSLLLQIQVLGRTLERGQLDAGTASSSVKAAEGHARRLSVLIDRLLDATRVASAGLTMHPEELDLAELVRALVAQLAPDFERAGCVAQLTMPERVIGAWDRLRMEQVVTNLLLNAMKFGEGRPIEIRLAATATTVRLSVRDHGIGISPEDQSRIFGRFERAVSVRHFGGLGLGLYLSLQIVRAHGGTLGVESEAGQGALFVVELPRTAAARAAE